MAGSDTILTDLEAELECAICLQSEPDDPRLLPCGHHFCLACIQQVHSVSRRKDKLQCSKCCVDHPLPKGGIPDLPVDHRTNSLIDLKRRYENGRTSLPVAGQPAASSDQPKCGICKGGSTDAKFYCITCERLMCDACCKRHDAKRQFADHPKAAVDGQSIHSVQCSCSDEGFITQFCVDCAEPVCGVCVSSTHKSHKRSDFINASKKVGDENENQFLEQLQKLEFDLKNQKLDLPSKRLSNDMMNNDIKEQLKERTKHLVLLLQKQEKVLCKECDDYHAKTDAEIANLEMDVDKALTEVTKMVQDITNFKTPVSGESSLTQSHHLSLGRLQEDIAKIHVSSTRSKIQYDIGGTCSANLGEVTFAEGTEDVATSRSVWRYSEDGNIVSIVHVGGFIIFTVVRRNTGVFNVKGGETGVINVLSKTGDKISTPSAFEFMKKMKWPYFICPENTDSNSVAMIYEGSDRHDTIDVFNGSLKERNYRLKDNSTNDFAFLYDHSIVVASPSGLYKYNSNSKIAWSKNVKWQAFCVCVDKLNRVLVADLLSENVRTFTTDGKELPNLLKDPPTGLIPVSLAIDEDNNVFVAYKGIDNVIYKYNWSGALDKQVIKLPGEPCLRSLHVVDNSQVLVAVKGLGIYMYKI